MRATPPLVGRLLASALQFNDGIVAESRAHPPSAAKLEAISALVKSAFQPQHRSPPTEPGGATTSYSEMFLEDEVLDTCDGVG